MFQIVIFFFIFSLPASANTLKTPPLELLEYESLLFPPQLDKKTVRWAIETSAESLFEKGYVDLGNMSDYMHIHAIFGPKKEADFKVPRSLSDMDESAWSLLEIKAYLIHTQEFRFLRVNRKYLTQTGEELEYLMRNWILWPNGVLEKAHLYSKRETPELSMTVRAGDLITALFGPYPGKLQFAFYFFRTHCDEVTNTDTSGIKEDNILQLNIRNEEVCLIVLDLYCRTRPLYDDLERCYGAKKFTPYYKDQVETDPKELLKNNLYIL